ncbi:armadillo repeat-containing protein 12 isoform X3 [Marmota monax]|uniref:armadillo repeat-containing protein 12 isoform X3 n=1 Tax=Marmota monax TaxID=9995 RepID=UPI0026E9A7F4|nr:armadillo repeat-containing protein 12 isoform X3 [Marmota monax]
MVSESGIQEGHGRPQPCARKLGVLSVACAERSRTFSRSVLMAALPGRENEAQRSQSYLCGCTGLEPWQSGYSPFPSPTRSCTEHVGTLALEVKSWYQWHRGASQGSLCLFLGEGRCSPGPRDFYPSSPGMRFQFWYPGSWPCQSSGSGRPFPGALGIAPTRVQGSAKDMGKSIPEYLGQLDIRKSIVGLATGASAIYLLYKAIRAGLKCQPPLCSNSPICIARECPVPGERAPPQEAPASEASPVERPKGLAIERERHGRDSGELRRLLNSLECKHDGYTRSMILHSIARCVYLLEAEASACTNDDIKLVADMLEDKDTSVKIQALNALKAFSGIRKFRLKIQEHSIKVLELVSTIWDSELHISGLRLLNNLPLPDYVHPQLRRVMPALMEILQSDYNMAQVQALRLMSYLAQKNDLLYDILNCQVHSDFLNLFQSTQPGNLLFELLVFAERLSEGRNASHYRAVKWHYNEQSLHEALFGDESRLADRLLSLVIHPEEEVQIQACKVIVSLQCPQDVAARPSSFHPSHSFSKSGE